MVCFHEVENHPGVLKQCASDPCKRHPADADIHADNMTDALRIMESRIESSNKPSPMVMRKHDGLGSIRPSIKPIAGDGAPMAPNDLDASTSQIAGVITRDDWSRIRSATDSLYAVYSTGMRNDGDRTETLQKVRTKLTDFITHSPDPSMRALRKFLGKEVTADDVASLIVTCPGSLDRPSDINNSSPARCILTRTSNDMDKKRVIATVLFFGGRCCYCGRPIHKATNGHVKNDTATADHLDPISPDDNAIPGETKFGNVVLCCHKCNELKANKSMASWLSSTEALDNKTKIKAIDSITAFRNYSLYSPMTNQQASIARKEIQKLRSMKDNHAKFEDIRTGILLAVSEIREAR